MISPLQGITAGLLLGFFVGAGTAWHFRGVESDKALLELTGTFETAVAAAKDDAIAEERRRAAGVAKVAEEGRKQNEKVEANATVNAGSTVSLSSAATSYAATAGCDTGPARRGEAATRAAMVLSELLGESNQRASNLAKTADDARTRGLTCERAYQALKTRDKSG